MKIRLTEGQLRKFLDEALGDEIPPYMRDIIQKRYKDSEKYLKMDIPKHTDIIPNVRIEVDDENIRKNTISKLVNHFSENIVEQFKKSAIYNELKKNIDLSNLIIDSIGLDPIDSWGGNAAEEIKKLSWLYSKEFRLPAGKTNSHLTPTFSNNKSGIASLLKIAKKSFPRLQDLNVESLINDKHFVGLRDPIINYQTNIREITDAKLYLYISDKPDDKLRMSISLFYDSCQNIYKGDDAGTEYNKKLLSNVFDENSKVAYLMFQSPFRDKKGNVHPFSSVARTILRVNDKGGVMFDAVYPPEMKTTFHNIIEEKTGLKNVGQKGDVYHYKSVGLPMPYMDTYSIKSISNDNNNSIENPRMGILVAAMGFDPADVTMRSDIDFFVNDEVWRVYTYDEAIEITRDNLRNDFDSIYSDSNLIELINNDVIPKDSIIDTLEIFEDDLDESGYDFDEYIEEVYGLKTLEDLSKYLRYLKYNPYQWYYNNVDFDQFIEYIGYHNSMEISLPSYDSIIHEYRNHIIIRWE